MNELTTIQLDVPGITFEPTRLLIEQEPTHEQLERIIQFTIDAQDASLWWAGDIVLHVKEKHGEEAARNAARLYKDPTAVWEAVRMCEELHDRSRRCFRLSYRHHVAAFNECGGDGAEAIKWIREADKYKWPVPILRAKIRASIADAPKEGQNKVSLTITTETRRLTDRIKAVTEGRPIAQWAPVEVTAFLEDMEPIEDALKAAWARYNEINPELVLK